MSGTEKQKNHEQVVFINSERAEVTVRAPGGDESEAKRYTYDCAFPATITQEEVYDQTARPIVESVMEGYNGTIFAYGQTGTGKTWTMEGDSSKDSRKGIIPRSFEQIFKTINQTSNIQYLVRGSFLEIYNNSVFDLLCNHDENHHGLPLKENSDGGKISVYAKGLTMTICKKPADLLKLLKEGSARRATASTNMNRTSSRSHCIFTCIVEQCPKDNPSAIRVGKLNMVDLAGSEKTKKTGAEGSTLTEAKAINVSLSALGNVISALTVKRIKHVPYRNSKLTRLLQDSLGGNTKTTMVAALGPADYNLGESISTLRFARRAKAIRNKPTINVNPKDALLMEMQSEIERLRAQLSEINSGSGTVGRRPLRLDPMGKKRVVQKVVERVVTKGVTKEELEQAKKEAEDKVKREASKLKEQINALKSSVDTTAKKKQELDQKVSQAEQVLSTKLQMRASVMNKLKAIQGQLIVGEKLKVQVQKDKLAIEKKNEMLRKKQREENKLKVALKQREAHMVKLEGKYASTEHEVSEKSKKLEKLRGLYKEIALEIDDVQAENQHEREDMLETIRELSKALKLKDLVLDNFVPRSQLQSFSKRCYWDQETDEWKLGTVDVKEESLTTRPKSLKTGHGRPISEFARISALLGDGNARFKNRDIMQMELIRPKRTTQDYIMEDEDEQPDEEEFQDDYHGEYQDDYHGEYQGEYAEMGGYGMAEEPHAGGGGYGAYS